MEPSGSDDLEAFISNPGGRRYWIKSRRDVICKLFKREILDETLPVPGGKVTEAIAELGEESSRSMEARIRTFIYRARKDRKKVLAVGKPTPVPALPSKSPYWTREKQELVRKMFKSEILNDSLPIAEEKLNKAADELKEKQDRRIREKIRNFIVKIRNNRIQKHEKGLVPSPLPSDPESADEGMEIENASEGESENKDQVNLEPEPVVQSLDENNVESKGNNEGEDSSETRTDQGTKSDSVDKALNEKSMDFENNNEVPFSPTKKIDKVDFVTDFLRSRGFDDITRETVFTWADAKSKEEFDGNPEQRLFNQVSECLEKGVLDGDIDMKYFMDSCIEASELSKISFDQVNHTEEIPLECSTSKFLAKGDNADVEGLGPATDVPFMKKKAIDEPMPSANEITNEKKSTSRIRNSNE